MISLRVRIAGLLLGGPASIPHMATTLNSTEDAVYRTVEWLHGRASVRRDGDAVILTPHGKRWVTETHGITSAKQVNGPRVKPSIDPAIARERLTKAGLIETVEAVCAKWGEDPMRVLADIGSPNTSAARKEAMLAVLDTPGRVYSSGEVAWLFCRKDGSDIRYHRTKRARREVAA